MTQATYPNDGNWFYKKKKTDKQIKHFMKEIIYSNTSLDKSEIQYMYKYL